MHRTTRQPAAGTDEFPRSTTGLLPARDTEAVQLADGGELDLRIAPVAKAIESEVVRMLAYNGSIPGPTLVVRQGSEIEVNVINEGDLEATVHWHGLRLENRYDGTHQTQEPIPVGGSMVGRPGAVARRSRPGRRATAVRAASAAPRARR
ncbi:MAG: multicopper oxidase domain-containing protein [Candidatus Dormibacteraeota bacterium]|nr:multicopper oxidase domain-containing protein [Candidatus Dormibacteraeota bacterium]